jgi:hypothetical protein
MRIKDQKVIASVPPAKLKSGSAEIRNWIALAGAMESLNLNWSDYIPAIALPPALARASPSLSGSEGIATVAERKRSGPRHIHGQARSGLLSIESAAFLEFFAAATWTRLVAANFRCGATYGCWNRFVRLEVQQVLFCISWRLITGFGPMKTLHPAHILR